MSEQNDQTDYEFEIDYKIENVVATVSIDIKERLDLVNITRKLPEVEYNPERFPGLILRVEKPKATFLIFSTGKMVVTGLRDESDAKLAVKKVFKMLKKSTGTLPEPMIIVRNVVASGDLHIAIDLNMAAIVMDNSMYEPEVFPGLIYRMKDPKCCFLIFSTGRVVCTGAKSPNDIREAIIKLNIEVRELNIGRVKQIPEESTLTFL